MTTATPTLLREPPPSAQRLPAKRAVPAVTRAIAILRCLSNSDRPLGVQAIARGLKLVPSTCLHILRVLCAEGLVTVDEETKGYRLGAGLLSLSRKLLKGDEFTSLAHGVLEKLAKERGVTAIGLEARGLDHVVVMEISRAREPFHIHVDVGSRFPALISASGRCIAAFGGYPEAEIRERFKLLRFDRPPSYREWRREVEEARRKRFSVDADRYILGVTVVSAPVLRDKIGVKNLLVVVGLSERIQGMTEAIGEELVVEAAAIARLMGD